MTTEERLAAIEANVFLYPTSHADVRWLIAEVRRLTDQQNEAVAEAPTIIARACDEAYARGRAEERAAVVTYLRDEATRPTIGLADAKVKMLAAFSHYIKRKIERGEHVAEVKDAT